MVGLRCAAYWLAVTLIGGPCYAQLATSGSADLETTLDVTADARVEETGPPIMYLLDDDGNPLPVVGIPFSMFEKLYLIDKGLVRADQPPKFALRELSLAGLAQNDRATLEAEVKLTTRVDGWIRVPLMMGEAQLQSLPEFEGDAEYLIRSGESGFELWIHGKADQQHTVSIPLLLPLERIGEETRLHLTAPHATNSRLSVQVPRGPWIADASEGSILSSDQRADGTTEYRVQGLGPDFQISWRKQVNAPPKAPQNLDVDGNISVNVDSRGVITSDVQLSVMGTQRSIQRIQLRLPSGARLIAPTNGGYSISQGDSAEIEGPVWDVIFKNPSREKVVYLRTQAELGSEGQAEIAAYEVLDAVRQSGKVTVASEGDWHIQLTGGEAVSRVSDSVAGLGVVASYEYYQQPCSLKLTVTRRTTRVIVEPIYKLHVSDTQVELQALLKYTVRGAKATTLRVALPGWQVDEVGPENLVRGDEVEFGTTSPLVIPIDPKTASDFEVQIRATRKHALTDAPTQLAISLPIPDANTDTPATVVVSSAENVSIEPIDEEPADFVLSTMPPGPDDRLSPAETPLYFRLRSDSPNPSLAISAAKLPQTISIYGDAELLEMTPERVRVRQSFNYKVEHLPLPQVRVLVPNIVDKSGDLQFLVSGKPALTSRVLIALAPTGADLIVHRLALPHPAIGSYQIVATYNVPGPGKPEELTHWDVPLLRPRENQFVNESFHIAHRDEWLVELDGSDPLSGSWTVEESNGEWMAATSRAADRIPLSASYLGAPKHNADSVLVERAWLQTWLTKDARRDRAVYRVLGAEGTIHITLPEHVDFTHFQALLNHQRVEHSEVSNRVLRIELPESDLDHHIVELVYHVRRRQPAGRLRIELPRIRGAGMLRQWFWHLILPENECVLKVSSQMISANRWGWSGWGWTREPQLDQDALEQWTGATHQQPVLIGANEYLFGAFDEVDEITVRTATIPFCLLLCSGGVFVAGLLLTNTPRLRRPVLLLPIVGIVLLLAIYNPTMAAVAGQAAVLGLMLVLVSRALRWMIIQTSSRQHGGDWTIGGVDTGAVSIRDGSSRVSTVSTAIGVRPSSVHSTPIP